MCEQDAKVLPPRQFRVLSLVKVHYGPAAFSAIKVAAEDQEGLSLFPEDERIAPVVDRDVTVKRQRKHRVLRMLAPNQHGVVAHGSPLFGVVRSRLPAADAGVKNYRLTGAVDRCATGEHMLFAGFFRWPERNG